MNMTTLRRSSTLLPALGACLGLSACIITTDADDGDSSGTGMAEDTTQATSSSSTGGTTMTTTSGSESGSTGGTGDTGTDASGSETGGTTGDPLPKSADAAISALTVVPNPAKDVTANGFFVTETDGKVDLTVTLENCPEGVHGLHIHAGTECGADGALAMGHWDPHMVGVHGQVGTADPHHLGDAGMVTCNAEGKALFKITTDEWSLEDGLDTNPIGQAVILHGLDASQRVACGVVEKMDEHGAFTLAATTLTQNPAEGVALTAHFAEEATGEVTLTVEATNCPEGEHGLHIHAGTECGEDGALAMGHWDPHNIGMHGQVGSADPHHAGDVGVLTCDAENKGSLTITTDEWTLEPGALTNPVGRAMILHGTNPANRVACGVIVAGD